MSYDVANTHDVVQFSELIHFSELMNRLLWSRSVRNMCTDNDTYDICVSTSIHIVQHYVSRESILIVQHYVSRESILIVHNVYSYCAHYE